MIMKGFCTKFLHILNPVLRNGLNDKNVSFADEIKQILSALRWPQAESWRTWCPAYSSKQRSQWRRDKASDRIYCHCCSCSGKWKESSNWSEKNWKTQLPCSSQVIALKCQHSWVLSKSIKKKFLNFSNVGLLFTIRLVSLSLVSSQCFSHYAYWSFSDVLIFFF